MNQDTKGFYDNAYRLLGFAAQRMYPNEELLRFFGSYYFPLSRDARSDLRILEVGCGSGANLWMIAREGFDAYGIDLSADALQLCAEMLKNWNAKADLRQGDMTALPYEAGFFQAVVDVLAAYCMPENEFERFLDETARVLQPGGRFFSCTPSKNSDAFRDPGPSRRIDPSTLDGIQRETSAFFGERFPFRFMAPEEFATLLEKRNFKILKLERVGRTYRSMAEYFEFVSIHAEKVA